MNKQNKEQKGNRHGLSRTIPEDVKRQIRFNSGFGCVICGLAFTEYEHVDPEYHDAVVHDPDKMTLLCAQHHSKVTRGTLSKKSVKAAMNAPFGLKQGFAMESLDVSNVLEVNIAGIELGKGKVLIHGEEIFTIKLPEQVGAPLLFSGDFYDSSGNLSLRIIDNEWQALANNWDVMMVGNKVTIRRAKSERILEIVVYPPDRIEMPLINMFHKGYRIQSTSEGIMITGPNGGNLISKKIQLLDGATLNLA